MFTPRCSRAHQIPLPFLFQVSGWLRVCMHTFFLRTRSRRKFAKNLSNFIRYKFDDHDWIRKCCGRRISTITWCATSTATTWPSRPSSVTTVVCGPRAPPFLRFSLLLFFPLSDYFSFSFLHLICAYSSVWFLRKFSIFTEKWSNWIADVMTCKTNGY